ncbi:MAG: competence/damage-inducible protein A [Rikenellaceae bacterium]
MEVKARIITIGDEILIGQIVDTNSAFIASLLEKNGVKIDSVISISDSREAIYNAVKESVDSFDITITTGGLGPTKDDITKEVLASIFNCSQQLHEPSYQMIKSFLEKRSIAFNELNKSQAVLPSKAKVLPNVNGTAPGLWFENGNNLLFNLPGVPHEMKPLMEDYVMGVIRERFTLQYITHRTAMTYGIAESILAERIALWEENLTEGVKLAYLPSPKGVRLRLTYRSSQEDGDKIIDNEFKKLEQIIGNNILGYDEKSSIESRIAEKLLKSGKTLSTAESCTGGKIASMFTAMSGASSYFKGGVVSYSNEVKMAALGVKESTLERFGAVSQECAAEMAQGAQKMLNTDYAIATTGIAGPTGGTEDKPVGTVWIAISTPTATTAKLFTFGDLREVNIARFSATALSMLDGLLEIRG